MIGAFAAILFTVGCQRSDRFSQKVEADSPVAFAIWRAHLADDFSVQERAELEAALQEIKFAVMGEHEATGSAGVDDVVRGRISGRTVRETLQLGYEMKFARLDSERATLELIIQKNARLRTRPDDTLSADYLAGQREQQSARLEKTIREIAATEEKLSRLDPTFKEHLPSDVGTDSGPVLLDHRRSNGSETPATKPSSKG
jgi:transcription elongation GreA/GreB family factor